METGLPIGRHYPTLYDVSSTLRRFPTQITTRGVDQGRRRLRGDLPRHRGAGRHEPPAGRPDREEARPNFYLASDLLLYSPSGETFISQEAGAVRTAPERRVASLARAVRLQRANDRGLPAPVRSLHGPLARASPLGVHRGPHCRLHRGCRATLTPTEPRAAFTFTSSPSMWRSVWRSWELNLSHECERRDKHARLTTCR